MSRVEVLIDKSMHNYAHNYALIKGYYDGRNDIAHGGVWAEQFVIPGSGADIREYFRGFSEFIARARAQVWPQSLDPIGERFAPSVGR